MAWDAICMWDFRGIKVKWNPLFCCHLRFGLLNRTAYSAQLEIQGLKEDKSARTHSVFCHGTDKPMVLWGWIELFHPPLGCGVLPVMPIGLFCGAPMHEWDECYNMNELFQGVSTIPSYFPIKMMSGIIRSGTYHIFDLFKVFKFHDLPMKKVHQSVAIPA